MKSGINTVMTNVSKLVFLFIIGLLPGIALAQETLAQESLVQEESLPAESHSEVISAFTSSEISKKEERDDETIFRHKFLFAMGMLLLISIFTTAYFGLSMVLFGKQVFVPHMIAAGFSVFLAVAHSVVAIVWFFPF